MLSYYVEQQRTVGLHMDQIRNRRSMDFSLLAVVSDVSTLVSVSQCFDVLFLNESI